MIVINDKSYSEKSFINAWIKLQKIDDQDSSAAKFLMWSGVVFLDLADKCPEKCWELILMVLEQTDDDDVLGMLASSPIEEMLANHPKKAIIWVEDEAKINPKFKAVLSGVWKNAIPDEEWERLQTLVND